MKLVNRGAEASIFLGSYLGRKCVVKVRGRKPYREKTLDGRIIRERIRVECNLLSRAKKAGVRTPVIWKIDLNAGTIVMEFIGGKTLKRQLLEDCGTGAEKLCSEMGKEIAKLHSSGLVHGDLTTSNIILHGGKLVFLDFGLGEISQKIESKAVDLLVLRKTFAATHFRMMEKWKAVEDAYARGFGGAGAVLRRMKEVEARARYY